MLSGDFWPSCEAKESNIPIDTTKIKNIQAPNMLHLHFKNNVRASQEYLFQSNAIGF